MGVFDGTRKLGFKLFRYLVHLALNKYAGAFPQACMHDILTNSRNMSSQFVLQLFLSTEKYLMP